jgi:hypothetical protein
VFVLAMTSLPILPLPMPRLVFTHSTILHSSRGAGAPAPAAAGLLRLLLPFLLLLCVAGCVVRQQ